MKAVRLHEFGGPEVLRMEDVPRPDVGPHDVLIRVIAASFNPIDAKVRELTRLLELSDRHQKEGLGDAPWPPH